MPPWLRKLGGSTDVALAVGVGLLIVVLVVPLPVPLLDAGLALSSSCRKTCGALYLQGCGVERL